jgi:predicted lipoprotein with Yx(FWY)xxD motif
LRNDALPYSYTGDYFMNKLILVTLATAFTANVAIAQSVTETNGILAASGRTLYTFDKDMANKSNCNGGCAAAWPPFLVKDGDRTPVEFRVIKRDDGTQQWAVNEKPLYFFAADIQASDAKGDGQGGVWHVIPGASKRSEATPAAPAWTSGGYSSYPGGY